MQQAVALPWLNAASMLSYKQTRMFTLLWICTTQTLVELVIYVANKEQLTISVCVCACVRACVCVCVHACV